LSNPPLSIFPELLLPDRCPSLQLLYDEGTALEGLLSVPGGYYYEGDVIADVGPMRWMISLLRSTC
jgi:hypothetical protein